MTAPFVIVAMVARALAGAVLMGTAPLPADGATASDVRVYVERCPNNVRARVKAELGKVTSVATGADCVVSFSFIPPSVTAPKFVAVTIQVQSDDYTVQIPVVPPFAGDVGISFDPPVIAAGGSSTVKLRPTGTSPVAAAMRRFVLTASTGTVDSPIPLGDGTYSARYTAPKTLSGPVMVAITAADAAAPSIQGIAGLPVTLRKSVALDAAAGSNNVLTVGGKQYGPFKADSRNKVTFEVDLDPRNPLGRLQSVHVDTSRIEREVPLPGVSQVGQLVFLPMPASIVADPTRPLPVRVVALAPNGEPVAAGQMVLTASAGTVSTPGPDGKVMLGQYSAPATAQEVTLGAQWNGLIASRKLRILAPLPRMTLVADPVDFPKGGGTVKVVARLKDAGGTALAGRPPSIIADGASLSGKMTDKKDGSYTVGVTGTSKTERASVFGTPPMDVSSLAPARLLAWSGASTLTANGRDGTSVTLVAVDAYDLPVANVEFKLAVPLGDGSLPPSVKSDARGVVHVAYRAGTKPGLQTLRVEAGGLITELPIFQVGPKMFVSPIPGGGAQHLAALERWQQASPTLTVVREGVVPPSGPPAEMQLSATPGYTTAGAAILVQVRITDENGVGVAGQKLQVSAVPAVVSAISDSRDGNYSFTAQLPQGQDGPLTVTVAAGTEITTLKLGTLEQVGSAKSAGTATTEGKPASAGGGSAKMSPPAGGGTVVPAGRFGAALVNLRGPYSLATDGGGGLADADLVAPDAGFWGLTGTATYGLTAGPGRAQFGADARFSANIYDVNGDAYLVFLRDITAGGRYLHPVADGISVGGGLDIQSVSAPYFTYTDEARTAANIAVGGWFGVRAVGQMDVDLPNDLHLSVDLAESFLWAPAATHVGALLDIPAGDAPVAVRLGIAWDWRYLSAADLGGAGSVNEQILTGQIGVVYLLR